MNTETLKTYIHFLNHGLCKSVLTNLLPSSGWIRNDAGQVKTFGDAIQRRAAVVTPADTVQFEFPDGRLRRVLVECGLDRQVSLATFTMNWRVLKDRVSALLGVAGISDDRSASPFEQRCRWTVGSIDVAARAARAGRSWRIAFDIRPVREAKLQAPASLEDLFES